LPVNSKPPSPDSSGDLSNSAVKLFAGMLIVDAAFIIGVLFAWLYFAGALLAYVFFVGAHFFVKRHFFRDRDPLEHRRWKRCWQGNVVGYHITATLLVSLVAGMFKSADDFIAGIIVYLGLACLGGIMTGLLWAQICDKKDKSLVLEAFRAWQIDRGEPGNRGQSSL
jgi:hypothetical protein